MAVTGPHEVSVKIVLAGAPGCGKSDLLRALAQRLGGVPVREGMVGETRVRRVETIWPEPCPDGRNLRVAFHALSGGVRYNAPEELLMRGVDGLLLVLDVSPEALRPGCEALRRAAANVLRSGRHLHEVPLVLQYHRVERHHGFDAERMDEWLGVPSGTVPRFITRGHTPDLSGGSVDMLMEQLMQRLAAKPTGVQEG
jgi:hypothetical protein